MPIYLSDIFLIDLRTNRCYFVPKNMNSSFTADTVTWSISNEDQARFGEMFYQSRPLNGLLDGTLMTPSISLITRSHVLSLHFRQIAAIGRHSGPNMVRILFPKSRIFTARNLVDVQKTGAGLGVNQFTLALALIQKRLSGTLQVIPTTLPPHIYAFLSSTLPTNGPIKMQQTGASQMDRVMSPTANTVIPTTIPIQYTGANRPFSASPSAISLYATPGSDSKTFDNPALWIVSPEDQLRYDGFFASLDTSKRNFITGTLRYLAVLLTAGDQAVPFFRKSGLADSILGLIWFAFIIHLLMAGTYPIMIMGESWIRINSQVPCF
jgi:hypothetical protein